MYISVPTSQQHRLRGDSLDLYYAYGSFSSSRILTIRRTGYLIFYIITQRVWIFIRLPIYAIMQSQLWIKTSIGWTPDGKDRPHDQTMTVVQQKWRWAKHLSSSEEETGPFIALHRLMWHVTAVLHAVCASVNAPDQAAVYIYQVNKVDWRHVCHARTAMQGYVVGNGQWRVLSCCTSKQVLLHNQEFEEKN